MHGGQVHGAVGEDVAVGEVALVAIAVDEVAPAPAKKRTAAQLKADAALLKAEVAPKKRAKK